MCKRMLGSFAVPLLLFLLMPRPGGWALTPPEGFAPGPDVIMGNLPSLIQAGSNGTQVGLMMGTDICNNGDVQANWFRLPETDHPVIPQNLYRMSGGANNNDRFEQVGQSWAMHQFFPLQNNACGFGCTAAPDGAHLGVGCSTADSASINASQTIVGSRAWINPFTGIFPSTANTHTGHTHDGTTHRILVEGNDLSPAMNFGATYYGEAQLVSAHEYSWCQSHPGQCNMFNNVSYRQFNVTGTTTFSFTPVGATVRETPAILAWPGATIQTIEPAPGVDGRAFIAYKVTQFGPFEWHYEYAIYNQNLDRGIQFFTAPAGCGIGSATNPAFHAPLNHPGIADDGTVGNAGYSNTPWITQIGNRTLTWSTESFAQNPNANALRWGTLYNFRFDGGPPISGDAWIGFFKTGAPVTVQVPGPAPECTPPVPSPTPPPTASPSPTFDPPPTPTATATATPTATATASPGSTVCDQLLTQTFDSVSAPALPPGWSSAYWVTSTTNPDTPPNAAFVDDPAVLSDKPLRSARLVISPFSAQVNFRNNYDLESSGSGFFDGGVLEISSPNINGGAFTDVTDPAVGGNFSAGGYNAIIAKDSGSPIAGRPAWSGNSGGYINTVVNLGPNVAGQAIDLRFRMVSDTSGAGVGWRIDTMWFAGVCGIAPPTPTPPPNATPTPTPSPTTTPPPSPTPTPSATPSPIPGPAQALNLSTRLRIEAEQGVAIGGFIITGNAPKTVAIRGIGPSLDQFGIPDFLVDPVLELYSSTQLLQQNDNWQDDPEQADQLTALGLAPHDPAESGMVASLSPGSYTAILSGKNGGTGVGLVEIYDTDPGGNSQLANVSTRGVVSTGSNVMIGGFILGGGSDNTQIAVRGIGPSISILPLPPELRNPYLELFDSNGALLIANDDWQSDPAMAAQLSAHGLALNHPSEPGIFVTLPPGLFTAILSGRPESWGTGTAVIEIYNLGEP